MPNNTNELIRSYNRQMAARRRAAIMQFLFEDHPGVVVIAAVIGLALAGGIINNIA